jgi:hypothetical protein
VSLFNSRFRGLFIAIVVLALSASAVFAAKAVPQLASFAGSIVAPHTATQVDGDEDSQDEDANEDGDKDSPEADDQDGQNEDADETASDNHGEIVSQAAHMATPDGFRNHGAFVSCVARMKDLGADGQPVSWDLVTREACDALRDEDSADETDTDSPDEDATEDEDTETASDNHGEVVSQAAQMPTPDGFRNHGAFVSCVAKMKDLGADGKPVDLTTITIDMCDGTTEADAGSTSTDADAKTHGPKANHGHGKGHGKSKHHG